MVSAGKHNRDRDPFLYVVKHLVEQSQTTAFIAHANMLRKMNITNQFNEVAKKILLDPAGRE